MDDQNPPNWERLGRYVKERRLQLGMRSQGDVARAGGPSLRVISRIENASSSNYSDDVILRTEKALRWEHGSWNTILAGGAPTPIQPSVKPVRASGPRHYPDFVGNEPFYQHIWDYPGEEVSGDERAYAILRVEAWRLRRELDRVQRRPREGATVGQRKVD